MSKFVRPKELGYPVVYYTFKAKDKNSDELVEYRVQDLPEEYFDQAIDLFLTEFLPDETLSLATDTAKIPEVLLVYRKFWHDILHERVSFGCFKNGSDELIAVNGLSVSSNYDKEETNVENEVLRMVLKVFEFCYSNFDTYKHYNVERYLNGLGLCVNREYRGRNIATEMLKARIPMLKAIGLEVTATVFTGIGSQVAAKKAGYDEKFSISCEELQKVFPFFDFTKAPATKCIKVLATRV